MEIEILLVDLTANVPEVWMIIEKKQITMPGEIERKHQIKQLINNNPAIRVVGPKYGDELVAYYAAADYFVFPSYREGFPNTVLEAGAMGLPAIVTDINGSREIIQDEYNGFVIPSKNVDELKKAMERMIVDESLRVKMAGVARSRIVERYEKSFVQQCQMDFYEKVLQDYQR